MDFSAQQAMQDRSEMQMQSRKLTVVFDKIPYYGQRAANVMYHT